MTPPRRRQEDDFGWIRRNWQFIVALAGVATTAIGVYYRTGALEDRDVKFEKDIEAVELANQSQWRQLGDLRDRVSRIEGKVD